MKRGRAQKTKAQKRNTDRRAGNKITGNGTKRASAGSGAKNTSPKKARLKQGLSEARYFLSELAGAFSWAAYSASHNRPMGWAEYDEMLERQMEREERQWLKYLERKKFLEIKAIGEKLMIRLTGKGWKMALRDRIRGTHAHCKNGLCILVIFDVPERQRHVRDTLRSLLGDCGFTMVQKSVWMTRKDVIEPLCALLQGAKLDRWVRIILGNELKRRQFKNLLTRAKA